MSMSMSMSSSFGLRHSFVIRHSRFAIFPTSHFSPITFYSQTDYDYEYEHEHEFFIQRSALGVERWVFALYFYFHRSSPLGSTIHRSRITNHIPALRALTPRIFQNLWSPNRTSK